MPHTNALAQETSPYLLQHAHNPVDWHAWNDATLALAREQGKPIFLSIGYSSCYWCHVMERQVFENAALAKQMNEGFINIKVDREQRPDVDELYMTATQMMTGRGGWPMSVFLTPPGAGNAPFSREAPRSATVDLSEDTPTTRRGSPPDGGLKPFWAGTYIPPEPAHGMMGFGQLLEALSEVWRDQRPRVLEQADRIAAAVADHLQQEDLSGPVGPVLVERAAEQLLRSYDSAHGGFGGAPKFPQPANLAFLLAVQRHTRDDGVAEAVAHTLDRMARGGMYDQIGGGFHRYSVDDAWLVPHFEKMLYDNGQLLSVYADACAVLNTSSPPRERGVRLWHRVLRETADYVLREMTDDSGAFFSAQDAEVAGREGGNYLWTAEQVAAALADEPNGEALTQTALQLYGLDRGTNFRDPHHSDAPPSNVLYLPVALPELAEAMALDEDALLERRATINHQLKAVRDTRPQPMTDDKVLVAWNGMAIAGLAKAGRVLGEPRFIQAAGRGAEAILTRMVDEQGELQRTMRGGKASIPAFLEDYAFLVQGLLELHRCDAGDGRYLDQARRYTDLAVERFAAPGGGYYQTLPDQADLFVRIRSLYDGATPAGNSRMAHNLLDLGEITGQEHYLQRAAADLRGCGRALREQGAGVVHLTHALLRALEMGVVKAEKAGSSAAAHEPNEASQIVGITVEPTLVTLAKEGDEQALQVTLNIAGGYHLNSPTPSLTELIPTRLELLHGSGLTLAVDYPEPEYKRLPFADEPLPIYEGQVSLTATLRRTEGEADDSPPRLVLRFQPCRDEACLTPQSVSLPVTIRLSPL